MYLDDTTFRTVIDSSPLVSIDLLVENNQGEFLLGQRTNRPAQGDWFVPGGRIRKNESLANAFHRLTQEELGLVLSFADATLQGPYDHFYQDSVYGDKISTHYVAIAYKIKISAAIENLFNNEHLPLVQHGSYRWQSVNLLLLDPTVHQHTKAYFLPLTGNT
jgi:colanic acid biosynthesis protein WcaH